MPLLSASGASKAMRTGAGSERVEGGAMRVSKEKPAAPAAEGAAKTAGGRAVLAAFVKRPQAQGKSARDASIGLASRLRWSNSCPHIGTPTPTVDSKRRSAWDRRCTKQHHAKTGLIGAIAPWRHAPPGGYGHMKRHVINETINDAKHLRKGDDSQAWPAFQLKQCDKIINKSSSCTMVPTNVCKHQDFAAGRVQTCRGLN